MPAAKFLRPSLLTAPFSYYDDQDYDDNVSHHDDHDYQSNHDDDYDHDHGHDGYEEKNVCRPSLLTAPFSYHDDDHHDDDNVYDDNDDYDNPHDKAYGSFDISIANF